eukprot:gnl/Chilomastix_cuspidata/9590.p1 GENE.gnl/Chilomastix_cuspidata/9590~~gnl/Chilomastix_cuspidata/9590.p1  ORF type:complete len:414 (-),score=26.35 gnl/Chilomastix_cuspidata/9590:271-1401(-)
MQTKEYKGYSDAVAKDFGKYKKELIESFEKYKKEASRVWGKKNAVMPDKKVWVQYRDNMKERNIVDFEKGEAVVEIAVTSDEAKDKKKLIEKVKKAVEKTVTTKPDNRSVIDIAKNPDKVVEDKKSDPVLKDQVADKDGKPVTEKNVEKFAKDLIKDKKVKVKNIKGDDGKNRIVVSVAFPLVPDHLKKRVDKYKKLVLKESEKRSLSPKLVFAVMETESAFNPTAKSPVPAFGLMQLVPVSGGRDAYRLVHGKDMAPTDKFLYNPENNVELGAAYIYILYYRYLDDIKDKESRLWCAIASYNTGVGNLLNTFAGKYSKLRFKSRSEWKKKGFGKINSMSSEEVYNHLRKKLPYEETRNYVVKVRNRMPKYDFSKN